MKEPEDEPAPSDRELDERHESDIRGEHRYPDTHQTDAEQDSARARDERKRQRERPQ